MTQNLFWAHKDKWPHDPPEWIFLARAALAYGAATYGDWKGDEIEEYYRTAHVVGQRAAWRRQKGTPGLKAHPPQMLLDDPLVNRLAELADQLGEIQKMLRDWAEAGDLTTGTRPIGGGYVRELAPVVWSTKNLSERFYCCCLHPSHPYSDGVFGEGYQYIYVSRSDFETLLRGEKPVRVPAIQPTPYTNLAPLITVPSAPSQEVEKKSKAGRPRRTDAHLIAAHVAVIAWDEAELVANKDRPDRQGAIIKLVLQRCSDADIGASPSYVQSIIQPFLEMVDADDDDDVDR